jgi:hypothetical protein
MFLRSGEENSMSDFNSEFHNEEPTALLIDGSKPELLEDCLKNAKADALLFDSGGEPQGIFSALDQAAHAGRTLFPGRWLPARRPNAGGEEGMLFWVARNDLSLRRLLSDDAHSDDFTDSFARPDESLALLGMPGDVLQLATCDDPREIQQRARAWIRALGVDRVAIALPRASFAESSLRTLAQQCGLPTLRVLSAEDPRRDELSSTNSNAPLLASEFQLDAEHRLPDESYVPSVRDLLHRASLLRERSLYERLPDGWCDHVEAELRALYSWHVSPLLRRAAALLQSILPVRDVQLQAPLPELRGVSAYLLGLSDQRPDAELLAEDPTAHARALALALQNWDRTMIADVEPSAWNALAARLAPWAEGGHLALCQEQEFPSGDDSAAVYHLCFSGQPLWLRTPLLRSRAGMPLLPLSVADRRALGWFDLSLASPAASLSTTVSSPAGRGDSMKPGSSAPVELFPAHGNEEKHSFEQLPLQLEGTGA